MTRIESKKLLDVVADAGLTTEEQSAFHKVAVGSLAVFIARTKMVSRVDFSRFTFEHPAVRQVSRETAKELKLGKVQAQLNFEDETVTEEQLLDGLRAGLEAMKEQAKHVPSPSAQKEAAAEARRLEKEQKQQEKQAAAAQKEAERLAAKEARKLAIQQRAEAKAAAKASPKKVAEVEEDLADEDEGDDELEAGADVE